MTTKRQFVRFLFLKLEGAWRRLPADEQASHKTEFGEALLRFRAKLLLRTYSLVGARGDTDVLLWQVADDLDVFQAVQTALFSTGLGSHFRIAYSYLGMTRRSIYQFPNDPEFADRVAVLPQDSHFLFVYPFVKTRAWYALSHEDRQAMMEEHITIGRQHPDVRLNTIYSYGLDDQEFVVAFESDDPGDFVDLVMELRESKASLYTLKDTPIFTCLQMSLWDVLDSLGGAPASSTTGADAREDGFTPVATVGDLEGGRGKRVYCGADAIALFKVDGQIYAVADRCPHGRASLSEGTVDAGTGVLQCPWHGGQFDLASGAPKGGPVREPIKTFEVKIEAGRILVRS